MRHAAGLKTCAMADLRMGAMNKLKRRTLGVSRWREGSSDRVVDLERPATKRGKSRVSYQARASRLDLYLDMTNDRNSLAASSGYP